MQRYFSNIYWHFVGSPDGVNWHNVRKPADITNKPKELNECLCIVEKILGSKKLLATCTERISDKIFTNPFCCVTDIPIKDLPNHAAYYGKVAIGFKPSAIHKSFLPVLYYPTKHLEKMEVGFKGKPFNRWLESPDKLETVVEIDPAIESNPFKNYLKLTDFSEKPEESFYQEREWRHAGTDFSFNGDDVAAIAAPSTGLPQLQKWLQKNKDYTNELSVVAWEFIENA